MPETPRSHHPSPDADPHANPIGGSAYAASRYGDGTRPLPPVEARKDNAGAGKVMLAAAACVLVIAVTIIGMSRSGTDSTQPAAVASSATGGGTASAPAETTGQASAPEGAPQAPAGAEQPAGGSAPAETPASPPASSPQRPSGQDTQNP